jgi:putative hemolysin
MFLIYIIAFSLLVIISAFFSSAETALISLNKIKLDLKARKKNKKAVLLTKILAKPDEFISTVLIGNNFVNIAAASISTVVFTRFNVGSEELNLLVSSIVTTIIILLFSEIIPKSYAYRYNEKISYFYAYPIEFFSKFFYPLVKASSLLSRLLFKKEKRHEDGKDLTIEEIKHFLSSEVKHFQYNPEALRMVHEIIDTAEKDMKAIMTPRLNVIALEEKAGLPGLKSIIIEKHISNIPVYRDNLDNIVGIIHNEDVLAALMVEKYEDLDLKKIMRHPLFVSEYSSLDYVLKQFKKQDLDIAVIVDEYGSTIGILTINDVFREIFGDIKIGQSLIKKLGRNSFIINGNISVEEVNEQLHLELPEKIEYTTMSGLFIYLFGKYPKEHNKIKVKNTRLIVKRMGKRKIEEIHLIRGEK